MNFAERFLSEIPNENFSYSDLEEFYISHLKSTGCFDWENDDKYLEEDEECDGTYEDEIYNQYDAEGFINLFGLPLSVRAMMKKKNNLD